MTMLSGFVGAFPFLLHAYWILATGAAAFALLPVQFARSFRDAVKLTAARGKLWEGRPRPSLGFLTDWAVPQSWFAHFYDLGAVANAVVLAVYSATLAAHTTHELTPSQASALTGLFLLQLHLTRRLLESNFLQHYPAGSHMHIVAYLFGLSYYAVLPLSLVPEAAFREAAAGKLPESSPTFSLFFQALRLLSFQQTLGAVVFFLGNVLQWHSHAVLAALRPKSKTSSGSDPGYGLPRGGGFEIVSCPHYLGEMVIYLGLALVTGQSRYLPWVIFTWVVVNLLLASGPAHQWYLRQFPDYPKGRRAVIPWVY